MPYDIKTGPIPPVKDHKKPRGPGPAYPFRDMAVGQWLLVPVGEKRRLGAAVKNARRNHGVHLQVQLSADGAHWVVMRVPALIPLPRG